MRKLYASILLVILAGCATSPTSSGPRGDTGIWQGKVLMTNEKTNHKKWANIVWASDSDNQRMRIDVSAIMDFPVATYIKDETGAHLWLFTEDKYYHSDDDEKLFKAMTKVSLDPALFFHLLGDPESPGEKWSCTNKEALFHCESLAEKTSFTVRHQRPDERIITINRDSQSLRLKLSRAKVQVEDDQFKHLPTSQFKTIKI